MSARIVIEFETNDEKKSVEVRRYLEGDKTTALEKKLLVYYLFGMARGLADTGIEQKKPDAGERVGGIPCHGTGHLRARDGGGAEGMSGHHSPTPWRAEVYRPAFAEVIDAEGHVVVSSVFKDDAEFIVRAVNAYTQGSSDFADTMDYARFVRNPAICGMDLSKKEVLR